MTEMLNNKLPLWYQIAQSLRSGIMGWRSPNSLRLPTETQIAQQYGVSIITVRQALKHLEDEGLIIRRRRLGTFVNPKALTHRPFKLLGGIEAVFAQHTSEDTDLLEKKRISVSGILLDYFSEKQEVILFRRLRKDQGSPVGYALNYVLPEYGKRITRKQLRTQPMTQVLRNELGVSISRIEDTVEATLPTPEIASILQMEIMMPVLFFTGVTFDDKGTIVDVARVYYRGDRYKFSVGFNIEADRNNTVSSPTKR
jgi:GntR family transcriptional regulator